MSYFSPFCTLFPPYCSSTYSLSAAAAVASQCEMHCGIPSCSSSTQVTCGAYLIEQAEQAHIWALGAYLAVAGTVAERRGTEQLLGADGSPVLSQGLYL